ncbi:hypothetical protein [Halegenticoccus soli]|uniref:hypothetical protein n=1 Tax=Halegenticoccus soli TaxID=1985678 RepID=UPI00117B5A8D|nr:hypothetical protein [Halegenticoccus soli]
MGPQHFEQGVQNVAEEDVAEAVVAGSDPQPYVDRVRTYREAGFDRVYLQPLGPNQEELVDFAEREILSLGASGLFADDRTARAERYFERYGLATLFIGAFAPILKGYELLSVASGALGLDLRSYLLASLVGRGGRYVLEAALVHVIGEAARTLTEVEPYSIIGAVTLVILAAYLLRRRWVPERWKRLAD